MCYCYIYNPGHLTLLIYFSFYIHCIYNLCFYVTFVFYCDLSVYFSHFVLTIDVASSFYKPCKFTFKLCFWWFVPLFFLNMKFDLNFDWTVPPVL